MSPPIGTFFGHRDKEFAGAAIFIQTNRQVPFVAGDAELVRQRLARVGQAFAARGSDDLGRALSASVQYSTVGLSFEPSR